jgi:cation diffusion facilitator family transporter
MIKNPKALALFSTLVNAGLAFFKFIIGASIHSMALMADALHSGLDIISSLVTFIGIKAAQKPADKRHPYGRERYESLAGFVVVLLLFITAGWILFEAIKNILTQESMARFSLWGIILVAVTIIINEVMARLKFSLGNKFSSLALVADAEHSRADAISSIAVLMGLILIKFFPLADNVLAILVALYIFYEAYQLSKESIDSLVDVANPKLEEEIKNYLGQKRFDFSEIKTRKIGSINFAEIKIKLNPHLKVKQATSIIKNLENQLISKLPQLKQVAIIVESHDFVQSTTAPQLGRRFRFRRGLGLGPGGECICPACGTKVPHQRGTPCFQQRCPKCNTPMTRAK